MDGQKAELGIKKHSGRIMMLVIVLVRNRKYGRYGIRETQVRQNT